MGTLEKENKLADDETKLYDLHPDCLEKIASFLDIRTKLNLLFSNKKVYYKLQGCAFFWKQLCKLERLDTVSCLSNEEVNKDDGDRLTWSGELLHSNKISDEATKWMKIYQRGIQMRRNLAEGKFEVWRLFKIDEDNLPVRKMTQDTQQEDLEILHNLSPNNNNNLVKRVRIDRYWNEEFLVLIQFGTETTTRLHDIFVWKWQECQKPVFLYRQNLLPTYPNSFFHTSFFMHKNFFVLMPDTCYSRDQRVFTSMVRVHDLNAEFKLVGKYDFTEDSAMKRHRRARQFSNETAHLHKLGDKAVALCRTPDLTFFIFTIPDCKLEMHFKIKDKLETSYEHLDLAHRFIMKDNMMIFFFFDPNFFVNLFAPPEFRQVNYGRLLHLDFDIEKNGDIKLREYPKFDVNSDYIQKICLNSAAQMTCLLQSGKIVIKKLSYGPRTCDIQDLLTIELTEPLKDTDDDDDDMIVSDGPSLSCGPGGDIIIAFRHFVSGRKIHAYNKVGDMLYEICLDEHKYKLESRASYVSVDIDGMLLNFLHRMK